MRPYTNMMIAIQTPGVEKLVQEALQILSLVYAHGLPRKLHDRCASQDFPSLDPLLRTDFPAFCNAYINPPLSTHLLVESAANPYVIWSEL